MWQIIVWYGLVNAWCSEIWCDIGLNSFVQYYCCAMVHMMQYLWCNMVWCDVAWCGIKSAVWYLLCDMVWYGLVWYGWVFIVWYGMVWRQDTG